MAYTPSSAHKDLETVMQRYADMLYRLCVIMLKNECDAQDAVQNTLIRYYQKAPDFESDVHEKAWLLRVATNQCRDILRYRQRHPQVEDVFFEGIVPEEPGTGILEALTQLPEKYRLVLTLYYVEEYKTEEIAKIIGKTVSAVKMRLQKGRKLLEEHYRKEYL